MQPGETVHPTSSEATPQKEAEFSQEKENSLYTSENNFSPQAANNNHLDEGTVSWEASEYIEHQKPVGWYAVLVVTGIALTVLAYIISSGDYITTLVVAVTAILFGVTAARKPRTLRYTIDHQGVKIGDKLYSFANFKMFSVTTDTAIHSIQLLPLKRFMPPISLHYPPETEEQIVTTLGLYLPYQEMRRDLVDRFMSRIRF